MVRDQEIGKPGLLTTEPIDRSQIQKFDRPTNRNRKTTTKPIQRLHLSLQTVVSMSYVISYRIVTKTTIIFLYNIKESPNKPSWVVRVTSFSRQRTWHSPCHCLLFVGYMYVQQRQTEKKQIFASLSEIVLCRSTHIQNKSLTFVTYLPMGSNKKWLD